MVSDDEIGKAGGQPLATTFQGGNGTGGANFVVGVVLSVGAFARLTTRGCCAGDRSEIAAYEDDAAHGPNAQMAAIRPMRRKGSISTQAAVVGGSGAPS